MNRSESIQFIEAALTSKLQSIQNNLDELKAGIAADGKSTAGDKHETGRAMAQLELEKLGTQYEETRKQLEQFRSLQNNQVGDIVIPGAFVKTSLGLFFIGVAFGKIEGIFGISVVSPAGKCMLQQKVNSCIGLNGKQIDILDVY